MERLTKARVRGCFVTALQHVRVSRLALAGGSGVQVLGVVWSISLLLGALGLLGRVTGSVTPLH